tara:strand:+ start:407 stop:1348 length:942 start_codon:yes stop_codon:yes gene_type:complete
MKYKETCIRKKCPVCLSLQFKEIYKLPYASKELKKYLLNFYNITLNEINHLKYSNYILCECYNCKSLFQKEIPNNFLMMRIYEKWISSKSLIKIKKNLSIEYYKHHAEEIAQIVCCFFFKPPSQLNFLDFGMGWGAWAMLAKSYGINSYGLELSKERALHAARNGISVINKKSTLSKKFDFINTEQVFEHIANPYETLKYLKSGLKRKGIIKISVPFAYACNRRLKLMDWNSAKGSFNSLNFIAPLEHINYYKRSSIIKMGEKLGFQEVKIPILKQYLNSQIIGDKKFTAYIKYLTRPIYKNIFSNYVFLQTK